MRTRFFVSNYVADSAERQLNKSSSVGRFWREENVPILELEEIQSTSRSKLLEKWIRRVPTDKDLPEVPSDTVSISYHSYFVPPASLGTSKLIEFADRDDRQYLLSGMLGRVFFLSLKIANFRYRAKS